MNEEYYNIRKELANLEYVLSAYARPTFLAITEPNEEDIIEIVISCNAFDNMEISTRVKYIFNLIEVYNPDIIKDRLLIVQAYSNHELDDVLEHIFDGELNNE